MPDLKYAVIENALPATASSTSDFTSSGFGTPAGAIVFLSYANTTNNPQNIASISVGYWDGTNQRVVGTGSDSAATSNAQRQQETDRVAVANTGGTTAAEWTISNITDGVRLTMDVDNTGSSMYCVVVLLGGTDMSCDCGTLDLGSDTNEHTISSLSYTPDVVLVAGCGQNGVGTANAGIFSFGAATATNLRRCMLWDDETGQGTSDTSSRLETDSIAGQMFNGSLTWTADITTIDATGFGLTPSSSTSGDDVYWMTINLGGGSAHLATLSTPTSTPPVSDAVTGAGFTPGVLMTAAGTIQTADTTENHAYLGLSAADGTTESSLSVRSEHNQGTSDADSERNLRCVDVRAMTDGSDLVAATLTSLDSDGWTRNYSAVHTSAKLGFDLALDDGAAAGGTANNLTLLGVG